MFHDVMAIERALPWLATAFAAGYFAGTIPFGLLLARALSLGDLRKVGSGNIGATNVLRTGNRVAAALTLVLDALKGAVPALLFLSWGDLAAQCAALGAFIGHCVPVWLRFRGGKGVATFLGIALALAPLAGAATCLTWLAAAFAMRISSVGALAAAGLGAALVRAVRPMGGRAAHAGARGAGLAAPPRQHRPPRERRRAALRRRPRFRQQPLTRS